MPNGNPFYVKQAPGIGPGLAGLGQTLDEIGIQKREEAAKQRAVERFDKMKSEVSAAMETGDPMEIAKVSALYPEVAAGMKNVLGVIGKEKEAEYVADLNEKILAGDPEALKQLALTNTKAYEAYIKATTEPEAKDERTKEQKNFEYAQLGGYEGTFAEYTKGTPVGKWQPWGYGQMRNTETEEIKDVQVPPQRGQIVRALPGGGIEIISGEIGKKPKKFSEVQAKTGGFATRVEAANKIAGELEDTLGFDAASISEAIKGAVPGFGNILSSEDRQVYNQAKIDFVTAVLRLESGAAIPPSEYEAENKKYFPQPGDKPRVIENKRKARERQLRILKGASGGAYEAMKEVGEEPDQPPDEFPSVTTQEEFDNLPSGAIFVEDGKQYRKP